MIVVGTSHHFRLGSIADALLHSASVPVALTPAEYEAQPAITRITCATGVREGHEVLVKFAIQAAAEWKVPLRLMSLVAVGEDGSEERRQEWGNSRNSTSRPSRRRRLRNFPPSARSQRLWGMAARWWMP